MIDTHAHYNSKDLKDLKTEIERVNHLGYLDKVMNIGLNEETNKEALKIAANYEKFYVALGIHPFQKGEVSSIARLIFNSSAQKVVALGETGLDYQGDLEEQRRKFIETILLVNQLRLPIIIHANNTNEEVLKILKVVHPQYGFVFHCFQPNLEVLKEILNMNGYISVGTPITRKTAKKSLEVIDYIPISHLLIELDYPYMSSSPIQDGKSVFHCIQKIKGYGYKELETILDENAKCLFKNLR